MSQTATESPFAGMSIERAAEPLPKRLVAGRESIPNPFLDAVKDSYAESIDPSVGPDKAVRAVMVPVDARGMTFKDTKRKDPKTKQDVSTGRWQEHTNVTTCLYLLRQAAIKGDIGVRIVVDYKDGKNGEHLLDVKQGKVRVRFLGQKRKKVTKKGEQTQQTAA